MILTLAGGSSQLSLIRALKQLDLQVIVVDRDSAAPGFELADVGINVGTHDADEIYGEIVQSGLQDKITGIVIKSSGVPVLTAATLSEKLHIPFLSFESARNILNKDELLKKAYRNNIRAPKLYENKNIEFPCLVKPSLSFTSKKGISLVSSRKDFETLQEKAKHFSINGNVNIEEYIEGLDFSAVYLNDEPIILLKQISSGAPYFLSKGFEYDFHSQHFEEITPIVKKIIKCYQIDRSLIQIDFRKNADGYHLIEIHLDFGGDYIFDVFIERLFGNSFFSLILDRLLTGKKLGAINYPKIFSRLEMIYADDYDSADSSVVLDHNVPLDKDPFNRVGYRYIEKKHATAAVILGGSILQENVILWAGEVFDRVIVVDKDSTAPSVCHADYFIESDSRDYRKIIAGVQKIDEIAIRAVYCGGDYGLLTVAKVSAAFGLPFNSDDSIACGLDKERQHNAFVDNQLLVPRQVCVAALDSDLLDQFTYPVVIKPVDSSGSIGVEIIYNSSDLLSKFETVKGYSSNGKVIIEEYIDGRHFDVNIILAGNSYIPCGVLERFFSPPPFCIPVSAFAPPALDKKLEAELYRDLNVAARSIGLCCGPVKADFIVRKNECYLLEISPRFHGDISTSYMLPLATPYSPVKALFLQMNKSECYHHQPEYPFVGFRTILGKVGTFLGISNKEEVLAMAGVDRLIIRKMAPARIESVKDNRNIVGFVICVAQTREELTQRLDDVIEKIQIEYGPL